VYGPRTPIEPEAPGVRKRLAVVARKPNQRIGAFGRGSQQRADDTPKRRQRAFDTGGIGPARMHRVNDYAVGGESFGPEFRECDLRAFGAGVGRGAIVVAR
jgi:hypothetical protein